MRSRVSRVDWWRESEEWKREKEGPGGEEATAQSWPPVGDGLDIFEDMVF